MNLISRSVNKAIIYSEKPEVEVHNILKLVGCKMFTIKSFELKWTHESLLTVWELMRATQNVFLH